MADGVSLPIFLICCQTDILNAVSYASCAYAMQHFSSSLYIFVCVWSGTTARTVSNFQNTD